MPPDVDTPAATALAIGPGAGETPPMPPVSLVVTDLDGTLWHTDDHVDPAVVDAIAELARRGVPLLVATGRTAHLGPPRRSSASGSHLPPWC